MNASIPGSMITPLMLTAVIGRKPLAELLLDRGADPDRTSALGATALDMASACGNSEVRAFLDKKTTVR